MSKNQEQLKANLAKLPDLCYGVLNTTHEIIVIKKGEKGYYKTDFTPAKTREVADEWVDLLNEQLDVTKSQRKAMEIGSMWGWDVPGANPDCYMNLVLKNIK